MFIVIVFAIAMFYVFAMCTNEGDELSLFEFISVVIVDSIVYGGIFVITKANDYIDRKMAEYRKNVRV